MSVYFLDPFLQTHLTSFWLKNKKSVLISLISDMPGNAWLIY